MQGNGFLPLCGHESKELGKGLRPVELRVFGGGNGQSPQEACPCIHCTESPSANGQGLIGDDWHQAVGSSETGGH